MKKLLLLLPCALCCGWGAGQPRPGRPPLVPAQSGAGFVQLNLKLPFTLTAQDYWVQKDGHYYVYQDDIIVGNDLPKTLANVRTSGSHLWGNGQIPVELAATLSTTTRNNCIESLNWLNNNLAICYRNRVATDKDYVLITPYLGTKNKGGSSHVGRDGGMQNLFIKGDQRKPVILHELLHAAGLYHEQARSDRDKYIKVIDENILKDFKYDFDKKGDPFGDYDLGSIMHYSATAFGKGDPAATTIKCYDASHAVVPCSDAMGTSDYPSAKDLAGVNYLYRQYSTFCSGFDGTYTEPVEASVTGSLTGTINWQKTMGQPNMPAPSAGKVAYVAMQVQLPQQATVSWHHGVKTVISYGAYKGVGPVLYTGFGEAAARQRLAYQVQGIPVNVPLRLTFTVVPAAWGHFPPHAAAGPHESYRYVLEATPSSPAKPVVDAATKTARLDFAITGHWESTTRFPHPELRPVVINISLVDKLRQKQEWGKARPRESYNLVQGKLVINQLVRRPALGAASHELTAPR